LEDEARDEFIVGDAGDGGNNSQGIGNLPRYF
jgi:hypothetical protein